MTAPRGSAAQSRDRILSAARDLFAERGVDGVSVRDIAEAAGVSHPLVHHYFGTKASIVDEILSREVAVLNSVIIAAGAENPEQSPQAIGAGLEYILTEGRTSLLLVLRKEMGSVEVGSADGKPAQEPLFPLHWADRDRLRGDVSDPRLVTIILGAAAFGLAALMPWLASAVGLANEDPDVTRRRLIDILVAMATQTADPGKAGEVVMVEAAGIEPASTDASAESLQA